jgi:membrane-associated phospholipid phosphatase
MQFITFLGSEQFFLLLIPLFYWCISKATGADLAVLLVFSSFLNNVIKAIFKEPRPFWLDAKLQRAPAENFSMPSGHAQSATVLFGSTAWLIQRRDWSISRRRIISVLLSLVILLVALSRVYLGVHYPGDVLVGIFVGLAVLILFYWLKPVVGPWLGRLPIFWHLVLALLIAGLILASSALGLLYPVQATPELTLLMTSGRESTLNEAGTLAGLVL